VQAREDHYFGWLRETEVSETDEVPGDAVVTAALARSRVAADGPESFVVPAGTWVDLGADKGDAVRVRHPWVDLWLAARDLTKASELETRPPVRADLLNAVRAFLEVPYLWGGTTARGLDCSGLVQLAYRLCGIVLTRDAHQQATEGRAVSDEPRAGDLLFFGTPVTHVGMYTEHGRMVHASGEAARVLEQPISERGTPVSVRRYLP
jgi:hypothetical protein